MSEFLDSYETRTTGREKFVRWFFIALALIILTAGVDWILNKLGKPNLSDIREQWRASSFLKNLRNGQYEEAYRLWGCDPAQPCRDYRYEKFLEDWGPKGIFAAAARGETVVIRHCDTGIIQSVQLGAPDDLVHLWVNSSDLSISFAPWPVCNPRIPVP